MRIYEIPPRKPDPQLEALMERFDLHFAPVDDGRRNIMDNCGYVVLASESRYSHDYRLVLRDGFQGPSDKRRSEILRWIKENAPEPEGRSSLLGKVTTIYVEVEQELSEDFSQMVGTLPSFSGIS